MNLTKPTNSSLRRTGARSLATLGFGVILAGFSAEPTQALTANSGTDYLLTPTGGAKFVYDPAPPDGPTFVMPYSGLPILTPTPNGSPNGGYSGLADTVVNRLETVDFNATPNVGITPIEIVGLSLFANNVSLPSGGTYDTVAGLQKYYGNTAGGGATSVGTMTIRDNFTWDSAFTVKAIAFFAAPGSLGLPSDPYAGTHSADLVRNIIAGIITPIGTTDQPYACVSGAISGQCLLFEKTFTASNEPWVTTPIGGQLLGDNLVIEAPNTSPLPQNFFISDQVQHDAGDGTIHTIDPAVPGPLPILGVGAAFKASRRLRRISRQAR
jgi:hypothetical protein